MKLYNEVKNQIVIISQRIVGVSMKRDLMADSGLEDIRAFSKSGLKCFCFFLNLSGKY